MSWHKIWDDPDSREKTDKSDVNCEISENSDAPTVEGIDSEIGIGSEPYKYLQGLNSDNLMQFSQQSTLQEMLLKEQLDQKPNLDVLPTFEEHDHGGYDFQLELFSKNGGKTNWMYSQALNKVYIRMNDILNVTVFYKPKMPIQQLKTRVLLTFKKEVSEPVLRCQNHISTDTDATITLRHYLLRCQNQNVEYYGCAEGKSINTRLSIGVPLGINSISTKNNINKQIIALKFTCQNSCIGRRETCLVFLLEGMNGEVLSQRNLDVKICSCPKRDIAIDERNITNYKRKFEKDATSLSENKICKLKRKCSSNDKITQNDVNNENDVRRNSNGSFTIKLNIFEKDIALNIIKHALLEFAGKLTENENADKKQYLRNEYNHLKQMHGKNYI